MEQEGTQNSLRKEGCGVGRVLIYACGILCDDRHRKAGMGAVGHNEAGASNTQLQWTDIFHHTRLPGISGMPPFKKADISEKAEKVLDISPWCRTRSHGTLGKIMMRLKSF